MLSKMSNDALKFNTQKNFSKKVRPGQSFKVGTKEYPGHVPLKRNIGNDEYFWYCLLCCTRPF